jgi:16S rRNA C967 or C1407 C5-methylase (RsmB/RsmF family)
LKQWSPNRIKTLCHLQSLLIKTLIPLLKPGGTLVYSTCALNPLENEEVISKALVDFPELSLTSLPANLPIATQKFVRVSEFDQGFDPMFVAVLQLSRKH